MLSQKIRSTISALVLSFTSIVVIGIAGAQELLAQERVKIGIIAPFTGPLAEFGVALRNGITLAQKTSPSTIGSLDFVYEDSQYNPQTAISIFRRLTTDSRVKLVINFGCPTSQAIAPIADQTRTPTALFCSSLLLTKGKRFSFGLCSPANEWASILWKHLESRKHNNLCLVLTQNDYLMNEYKALQLEMQKHSAPHSLTVIEEYTPTDTDFRSSVLKMGSKSCDALGVYLLPNQVRTFLQQSRHVKLKAEVFGTAFFESRDEIVGSNGGMERSVFVNLAVPKAFDELYISEFNNDNQVKMACVAHDLIVRVSKTLQSNAADISPEKFIRAIQESGTLDGACGTSSFIRSDTGEQFIRYPLTLKRIEGGEIKNLAN
jgi:branched-chain amino acid transport system substrate-binding protein